MADEAAEANDGGIRGVVLDFGEVLCHKPALDKLGRMADALDLPQPAFIARYSQERAPYDQGILSPEGYWSKVAADGAALNPELLSRLRQWDVEMWSQMDLDMVNWLDRLRDSGFKTAILSNMHGDMAAHVRRNFAWLRRVDCPILSSELRLIKPDPAIYERCLDCLGLPPSEVVFIDDRETNVAAARALGIVGLRFQSVGQLRVDLGSLGIVVVP